MRPATVGERSSCRVASTGSTEPYGRLSDDPFALLACRLMATEPTQLPSVFAATYERPPGINRFSVVALVLGIVGLWPLAAVFGVKGIKQTNVSGQRGRGHALAGIWLSALWLLAQGATAWAVLSPDDRTKPFSEVVVGDCLVWMGFEEGQVVFEVETVPCTQPHRIEVYAKVEAPFQRPGSADEEFSKWADDECLEHLAAYSPEAAADPNMQFAWTAPVAGRGMVTCFAISPQPITSSLAD